MVKGEGNPIGKTPKGYRAAGCRVCDQKKSPLKPLEALEAPWCDCLRASPLWVVHACTSGWHLGRDNLVPTPTEEQCGVPEHLLGVCIEGGHVIKNS